MKPMKKFWPILAVLFVFSILFIFGKINASNFYKENLNVKIVDRKDWAVQTVYFYLDNKIYIDSNDINNFDLKIGDSISKLSRVWKFDVYRKNSSGKYVFISSYEKSRLCYNSETYICKFNYSKF